MTSLYRCHLFIVIELTLNSQNIPIGGINSYSLRVPPDIEVEFLINDSTLCKEFAGLSIQYLLIVVKFFFHIRHFLCKFVKHNFDII